MDSCSFINTHTTDYDLTFVSRNDNTTRILTNKLLCDQHVGTHFTSRSALVQHIANSGCKNSVMCFCDQLIDSSNAASHLLECMYFGPIGCTECPLLRFKNVEKANNHAWNSHTNPPNYTNKILDTVKFFRSPITKFEAHASSSRFGSHQFNQLLERAHNNALKRTILIDLALNTDFASRGSHFSRFYHLSSNKRRPLPLFKNTEGRFVTLNLETGDGLVVVRANPKDKFYPALMDRLLPLRVKREFIAHGYFSFPPIKHTVDITSSIENNPALANIMESLNNAITTLGATVDVSRSLMSLILKVLVMWQSDWSPAVISLTIADFFSGIAYSSGLATFLFDKIKPYLTSARNFLTGRFVAQDALTNPIESVTAIMGLILGTFAMSAVPDKSKIDSLTKGVVKLGSFSQGLTKSWDLLAKLVKYVTSSIYTWTTGLPSQAEELERFDADIGTWFTEVKDIASIETYDKLIYDNDTVNKIERLEKQALDYSERMASLRLSPDLHRTFMTFRSTIGQYYKRATESGAAYNAPRCEPLLIYLYGSTSVGKTTAAYPLVVSLLDKFDLNADGTPDWNKEIYFRNTNQDFWDGYKHQKVCIYDDFAQSVDSVSSPNAEFLEIIKTANISKYPLHVANLLEKDKAAFTSEILLCTSNIPCHELNAASLADNTALKRRFHIVCEVVPADGFGASMLTGQPVAEGETLSPADRLVMDKKAVQEKLGSTVGTSCYKFIRRNALTGEEIAHLNFNELVQLAKETRTIVTGRSEDMIYLCNDMSYDIMKNTEGVVNANHKNKTFHADMARDGKPETLGQKIDQATEAFLQTAVGLMVSKPGERTRIPSTEVWDHHSSGTMRPIMCESETFYDWTTVEIECFYNYVYPHIERCMTPEAYHAFGTIKNAVEKTFNLEEVTRRSPKLAELQQKSGVTSIVIIFRDMLEGIYFNDDGLDSSVSVWRCDAGKRLADLCYTQVGVLAHAHMMITGFEPGTLTNIKNNVCLLLEKMITGFKSAMSAFIDKVKEAWKSSKIPKYLVMLGTCFAAIVGTYYLSSKIKNYYHGDILDSYHWNMQLNERVRHSHKCMWCDKVYTHTHSIADRSEALDHVLLCGACQDLQKTNKISADRSVDFSLGRPMEFEVDVIDNATGAPKTRKFQIVNNQWTIREVGVANPRSRLFPLFEVRENGELFCGEIAHMEDDYGEAISQGLNAFHNNEFDQEKFENMTKDIEQKFRAHLHQSGDSVTRKKMQNAKAHIHQSGDSQTVKRPKQMIAHLQFDEDADQNQLLPKIKKNMYFMKLLINDQWKNAMCVLMLKGKIGLTAKHLLPFIRKSTQIKIENAHMTNKNGGSYVFNTSSIRTEPIVDYIGQPKDQMLISFPNSCQDHVDITRHIVSSKEISRTRHSVPSTLVKLEHTDQKNLYTNTELDGTAVVYDENHEFSDIRYEAQTPDSGTTSLRIRNAYIYPMRSSNGDCGTPLVIKGKRFTRKIAAIHVAGNGSQGVGSPLNIEQIEQAMNKFGFDSHISPDLSSVLSQGEYSDVDTPFGSFTPYGKSLFTVASPTKTALRHSSIHGVISEPTTLPSTLRTILVDNVPTDPMQNGLKKAGTIPPPLNPVYVDAACNDMEQILLSNSKSSCKRLLTDEEMIAGVEDDPYIVAITRTTSPGFPWLNKRDGFPGKTKWLGDENTGFIYHEELKKEVDNVIECAKIGKRYPCIWIDTLKDERRPIAKVKAAKTRVFSAGPQHYSLAFRKYFGGFIGHCAKNRITNEISVGTNVYSIDWDNTARRLKSKGKRVIAGDFSNFDGTLVSDILVRIVDIINKYYDDGEENARVRRVLWREITHSIHLCRDNIYQWTHSIPSGCPITAVLNSIFNSISMRYVWLLIAPEEQKTMRHFNDHVAMVSYGDDNCVNISNAASEFFDQTTIAQGYAQIGMTYTDELKSGEMIPYRTLEELSYLKRKFRYDEESCTYKAPLEFSVVLEMMNWIRGDEEPDICTLTNMETSAFELALHGRTAFEEWIPKYKAAARELTCRPTLLTYEQYANTELKAKGQCFENTF